MTRKRTSTARVASSRVVEDFKLIRGVGPLYEKHLHDAGIRTFAKLAKLSPDDIATHLPTLSASQIRKQGWVLQARKLAAKKNETRPRRKKSTAPTTSQHYENFTVEFLLNEKNKLRRLRIVHVQSGDVETWANWQTEEVSHFLLRHTGAKIPKEKIHRPKAKIAKTKPTGKKAKTAKPVRSKTEQNHSSKRKSMEPTIKASLLETAQSENLAPIVFGSGTVSSQPKTPQPQIKENKSQTGTIHLLNWNNFLTESDQPVQNLPSNQNFDVQLTLDISNLPITKKSQLDIAGTLLAKKLGTHERKVIGETQMVIPYSPIIKLCVEKLALEQGLYRLEAEVKLSGSETMSLPKEIGTLIHGGLFQVY